jgi:hypothetical protein
MDTASVTLLVVIIGTFASVAVAAHTFQGPKARVTIQLVQPRNSKSKIRYAALGEPEYVNDEVHIAVTNVGHKNIKIDLPDFSLQDGRKFETNPIKYTDKRRSPDPSRLPINCNSTVFPHLLVPGDSVEVWVNLKKFAKFLKFNDYSGEARITFQFPNETNKRSYRSGEYSINVAETLKLMK